MDYPDTQYIEVEREEAWMTLWFNQAEKRNPLTDDATAELKSMFKILRQDRSVRGVTLRGRGGVFCSGGDLKSFKSDFQSSSNRGAIMEMSRGAADLFDGFNSLPQVTVSIVEGAAVAGGFGLVCCLGLADFAGDTEADLMDYERSIRAQVMRCAPGAVADTKALLIAMPELPRDVAVEAAAENFTGRMLSDEAKEGLSSFFEKRKAARLPCASCGAVKRWASRPPLFSLTRIKTRPMSPLPIPPFILAPPPLARPAHRRD